MKNILDALNGSGGLKAGLGSVGDTLKNTLQNAGAASPGGIGGLLGSAALGGLLGLVLGYGLTCWAAQLFAQQTGVLAPVSLGADFLLTFGLTLGLGGLAALLPAVSCWRIPVAAALRE